MEPIQSEIPTLMEMINNLIQHNSSRTNTTVDYRHRRFQSESLFYRWAWNFQNPAINITRCSPDNPSLFLIGFTSNRVYVDVDALDQQVHWVPKKYALICFNSPTC